MPTAEPLFKPGDIVQLKSGGPKMTVNAPRGTDNDYHCKWFGGSKLSFAWFAENTLKKVEEQ